MGPVELRIDRNSVRGMSDEDLCCAVVDPVWPTAEIVDELGHIAKATPGQRTIYSTMLYAREVDNGGLRQFLSNSSGMYSQSVSEGLRLLDAAVLHPGFETVLSYFPDSHAPTDRKKRKQLLENFSKGQWEAIGAHEKDVYGMGGFETVLVPYWVRYINEHPGDFFL
jgi:hypothetical protein